MFDFDATLPLMAVQFLILMALLNAVFFKPLSKALDERDNYIRQNYKDAEDRLAKTQELASQYERELAQTRKAAQEIVIAAQNEAQERSNQKIAEAQREAQQAREKAAAEIEQQKQEAMQSLEGQVSALSRQMLEKLLGADWVNS
ncbi:MAG TPA: F0F1 ATP synthase subunit B' [Oscillatoriales cyanobacterium M59_W2019_021]|nr:MAG: F0F1 ATP synthase subunit B' [Cyanobacteria bacterium J055]HIK30617.1 F0F1 ATP synthase subunit B' [Oscillatoriales cyanobacterium M4454_W2019_049]HIK52127.1 F0F1 ATP synthase subunit B' [Oscillatoriales cyanobacterium M59_W2019_021]